MEVWQIILFIGCFIFSLYCFSIVLKVLCSNYPERPKFLMYRIENLAFDRYCDRKINYERYKEIKEKVNEELLIPMWKFYLNPLKWTERQMFLRGEFGTLMKIKIYLEVL